MVSYGYQGAFAEEFTELDMAYNEFFLRTYDPQIGRFIQADPFDQFPSPYLGMGNDPVSMNDPSGGFAGMGVANSIIAGAAGGAIVGGAAGLLSGNSENAWKWALGGAVAGALVGLGSEMNWGGTAANIKCNFANFLGKLGPSLITTAVQIRNYPDEKLDGFQSQFKKNEVKQNNSSLYEFRKKHFKRFPGPALGMTTEAPRGYSKAGNYFKNDSNGELAMAVTVTKTIRLGDRKFTQSKIHFATSAFYSPETLFNVMGHEMGHLKLNIDEVLGGWDKTNQDQQHSIIYLWQFKLAQNMGWEYLKAYFTNMINDLNLQPAAQPDKWMEGSLDFLPKFYK